MNPLPSSTVILRADLVDPTEDGILTSLGNYTIAALAVCAMILAAWHGFKEWKGKKGEEALKVIREHVYGLLGIEAFFGVIALIANKGFDFLPGFFT